MHKFKEISYVVLRFFLVLFRFEWVSGNLVKFYIKINLNYPEPIIVKFMIYVNAKMN